MTHTINEARMLTNVAKESAIVIQIRNQGASSDGSREANEWVKGSYRIGWELS